MKKIVKSIAFIMICGMSVSAAELIWDIKYDADVLPTASGSVKRWDGSAYVPLGSFVETGSGITSQSVTNGIFSASTIDSNGAGYWARPLASTGTIAPDSSTGYTVELRMKATVDTADWFSIFSMEENGAARFWSLQILQHASNGLGVRLDGSGTNMQHVWLDDSEFHTYRITATDAGVLLYVDGSVTPTDTTAQGYRTDLSQNEFRVGDFTSDKDTDFDLDYIGIYTGGAVPPASPTISLIIMAGQ